MLVDVALVGYGAAAAAYLVLAVLLLLRGAPTSTGRLFVAAIVVEALWAATLGLATGGKRVPAAFVGVAESTRFLLWVVFLLSMLRRAAPSTSVANIGLVAAATLAAGAAAIDASAFGNPPSFLVHVVCAVFVLVCLEQIYRNTPQEGRWALKFLAIALLALFGLDLVIYSEALLFSRLNPALWTARGYANALLVPLLAIGAARNSNWKLDITVSRQFVFHSAALFAAGLYLIVMAAGGYWIRWFGGRWGEVAQALFVFGALIALAVALGSGRLRARLRVYLAKNFFRYRYDYRNEWLKLTELLSGAQPPDSAASGSGANERARTVAYAPDAASPGSSSRAPSPEPPLEERSLQGLCALVESNGGALWLSGEHGEFACVAQRHFAADTPHLTATAPLIAFLRERRWVIDLEEWRADPDAYEDLRVPAPLADDANNWLIVPLLLHEDLLGFALLTRPLTAVKVDWEVRDALKAAARQIASYLAVRRAVEALVTARQFESFNRMSAFVVHDLKNLVAQLTLLTQNAAKHRHNPEFQDDMLETVQNVLARMQGLLMQLRSGTKPIEKPTRVSIAPVIEAAVRSKRSALPQPRVTIGPGLEDACVLAHADRLERVIGHLVQNAAEATPDEGSIEVRLLRQDEQAVIEVEDDGKGMSERFIREQLFRPFASTKEHGMGIGTFESREYIRELGGTMEVASREGAGTTFRIRLPLARVPAAV